MLSADSNYITKFAAVMEPAYAYVKALSGLTNHDLGTMWTRGPNRLEWLPGDIVLKQSTEQLEIIYPEFQTNQKNQSSQGTQRKLRLLGMR